MKIVGIITEYNPFHNGHEYQIKQAKKITGADTVVVIMSGCFSQQGNIAILDKFSKSSIAIKYGVDVVIELPTIYSISSAETFANGAINILDKLNCIDYLVFGAECTDLKTLQNIAYKIKKNDIQLSSLIKENLKSGISYAKARDLALKEILVDNEYSEISKPNNILAIEYLKCISSINSKMKPVIIPRNSANHNDSTNDIISNFASGTAIRELLYSGNIQGTKCLIPSETYTSFINTKLLFNQDMYSILRYKILNLGPKKLSYIYEINEGLENKITEAINKSSNYQELIKNIKSKRYLESKIKRILLYILLDINKETFNKLSNAYYARILKVSDSVDKNYILNVFNKNSSIPIITSINDKRKLNIISNDVLQNLDLDMYSTNIYNIIKNTNLYEDKTNML